MERMIYIFIFSSSYLLSAILLVENVINLFVSVIAGINPHTRWRYIVPDQSRTADIENSWHGLHRWFPEIGQLGEIPAGCQPHEIALQQGLPFSLFHIHNWNCEQNAG